MKNRGIIVSSNAIKKRTRSRAVNTVMSAANKIKNRAEKALSLRCHSTNKERKVKRQLKNIKGKLKPSRPTT